MCIRDRVDDIVRNAAGLAAHHIDDAEQAGTPLPRLLHRRERVSGLAGLGHSDDELPLCDHRLAVAVLAGDIDVTRDAGETFNEDLADERGMTRGAASDERDA